MDSISKAIKEDSEDDSYCPSLPPHLAKSKTSDSEDEDEDSYGPALPPHLANKNRKKDSDEPASPVKRSKVIGPSLPCNYVAPPMMEIPISDESSSSEEDVIGPMPASELDPDYKIREIELRASRMKDSLTKKDDKPLVRESWMLELPDDKPNLLSLGLGPRKFAKNTPREKGDRSVWTDLPADKEKKLKQADQKEERKEETLDEIASRKRDEELGSLVNEYNANKRATSLVDMHKSKKKKDESSAYVRRPFSREEDLNVNKFDEAQKATIMKKAAQLNDRFSSGGRKFL